MTTKEKLLRFERWKADKITKAKQHREIDKHCDNCEYGERFISHIEYPPKDNEGNYLCGLGKTEWSIKCSKLNKIVSKPECWKVPTNCKEFKFKK